MSSNEEFDYYKILDIPRTATSSEIKKAYRKQALLWHPDKNPDNKEGAEKRFKQIAEAYEVLSDKDKKSTYDRFGKSGLSGNSGGGGPSFDPFSNGFSSSGPHFTHRSANFHFRDPMDIFAEFFGGGSPFEDFMAPRQRSHHSSRAQGQGASRHADPFAAFGFGGFGHMGGFDDDFFGMNMGMGFPSMMNMGGGHSTSISMSSFGGGLGNIRMSSESTKLSPDGKMIKTKKVTDANGVETVTIEENGVKVSCKVNGQEQLERIAYAQAPPQPQQSRHSRSRGDTRQELTSETHTHSKRRRN